MWSKRMVGCCLSCDRCSQWGAGYLLLWVQELLEPVNSQFQVIIFIKINEIRFKQLSVLKAEGGLNIVAALLVFYFSWASGCECAGQGLVKKACH